MHFFFSRWGGFPDPKISTSKVDFKKVFDSEKINNTAITIAICTIPLETLITLERWI